MKITYISPKTASSENHITYYTYYQARVRKSKGWSRVQLRSMIFGYSARLEWWNPCFDFNFFCFTNYLFDFVHTPGCITCVLLMQIFFLFKQCCHNGLFSFSRGARPLVERDWRLSWLPFHESTTVEGRRREKTDCNILKSRNFFQSAFSFKESIRLQTTKIWLTWKKSYRYKSFTLGIFEKMLKPSTVHWNLLQCVIMWLKH